MRIEINNPILRPKTFKKGKCYIITNKVMVYSKVHIEDGTIIYIRNDSTSENGHETTGCGLVFAASSELIVDGEVNFFACNSKNEKINEADNGGLIFNGTAGPILDSINNEVAYNTKASKFVAKKIRCHYLGGSTLGGSPPDKAASITINNCNDDEWNVESVSIKYSGGNGLTVNQSQIDIDYVSVENTSGDYGLEVTNSTTHVNKGLKIKNGEGSALINMNKEQTDDNNPLSYIKLPNHARVYLEGDWVDGVKVVSKSLPQPKDLVGETTSPYYYRGCIDCGQSYMYQE